VIVERRLGLQQGDVGRGRVVLGGEDVDAVAEARGGHREHAPQLAAAEYAERGAGEDRRCVAVGHASSF
jgi:hypothetical protein